MQLRGPYNVREFLGNRIRFKKEIKEGLNFLYTSPESPPQHKTTWGCLWTVLVSVY